LKESPLFQRIIKRNQNKQKAMNKKVALASALLLLAMPFASVLADDTTTSNNTPSTPTDCGTMPTRPAAPASASDLQTFRQQMHTYFQCEHGNIQGQHQTLTADKQANTQQRCQNIQTRISDRISRFNGDKSNVGDKFGDMVARLQQLSTNLSAKGVDVTQLNANIATLQTKINQVLSDQSALVSALQTLQGEAPTMCGTSHGQFMSDLMADRQNILKLQQDRLAVRTFFVGTIQPELMAIRQSLATTSASTNTAQ
jgi:maltooligosyltrehalose synthase